MKDGRHSLLAALGRIPSGLFILTAHRGGRETGMLASWVQQCAFEPPHVSVAVKKGRPLLAWLTEGAFFTLNILDHSQTDMIGHFGRGFELDQPAFLDVDIEHPEGGAPVLRDALAYLQCRVAACHPVGDHELLVAEVVGGQLLSEDQPMVHIRKSGSHY